MIATPPDAHSLPGAALAAKAASRPDDGNVNDAPVQLTGRGSILGTQDRSADIDAALFAALERLEHQVASALRRARESVVSLEYTAADAPPGTRRVATGVVINNRGEILSVRIDPPLTGQSSGTGQNPVSIVARDFAGHCYIAHWVAADPETGLTLLRLSSRAVRPIRMAAGGPNLGSQVFVVGNPFGMGHSVSRGHVAGLDRALELGTRQLGGLIQIQASLYPGDSGAAVVDLRGECLGLIRSGLAIPSSGSGSELNPRVALPGSPSSARLTPSMAKGETPMVRPERDTDFGFAVPAPDVVWVASQLRTRGRVDRAYLGVRLEAVAAADSMVLSGPESVPGAVEPRSDATPSLATSIALEPNGTAASAQAGAVLREVLAGTPAAEAGLQPGDGIVALDGQPIRSALDLTDRLDRIPARTTVLLGVARGRGPRRRRISLSLRTASRPDPPRLARTGSPGVIPASAPPSPSVPAAPRVTVASSTTSASSAPRPNELQLTLPRAVVERLEQLERRLEKLESSPVSARALILPAIAQSARREIHNLATHSHIASTALQAGCAGSSPVL